LSRSRNSWNLLKIGVLAAYAAVFMIIANIVIIRRKNL